MSETPALSIYEKAFSQTDKTDAILVVEGKKLHVNKALLSCLSDYFDTLFNSNFKEKSMSEIEIKDVEFEDFATLLSLIMPEALPLEIEKCEKLLELSDRFLLPVAKRHVALFIAQSDMDKEEKLIIGDKFDAEFLVEHALSRYRDKMDYMTMSVIGENFSQKTKVAIFDDFFFHFGKDLL
ncbi:hypothetical protein B9Z55_026995 [Caenorhabditis nigoni]|uniref:BTB domain-containing protein n=1 Tax=Caenorhabditis nigoni TaxID=1611254 RepID=A0A2G5SI78_9PELO|nr:hypothetical protein B9Z55_026995 [Caenorhabditis nigoni]